MTTVATDLEASEIHLSASRRRGTINASLLACASFALAALVAVVVLEQSHLPSGAAGYVFAAVLVAGFMLLGLRAARAALRACRSGVRVNHVGIVLHNPTNDIPISWGEIAGFEVAGDARGMTSINPYTVGRVKVHDGRSYFIEGTRCGGVAWRRSRRREEVQRCVEQLNELLMQTSRAPPTGATRDLTRGRDL